MKDINDFVKWISGMGLVIIALVVLALFMYDYGQAQQQANQARTTAH